MTIPSTTNEIPPSNSANIKKELSKEELEIIKEKRKERRKRDKENKKKLKEQQKRAEYYAPKSSKINVVSADALLRRYYTILILNDFLTFNLRNCQYLSLNWIFPIYL